MADGQPRYGNRVLVARQRGRPVDDGTFCYLDSVE